MLQSKPLVITRYGFTLQVNKEDGKLHFQLTDAEGRSSPSLIELPDRELDAYRIARKIEWEFNRANNVILEPYFVARLMGLVEECLSILRRKA